MKKNEELKQNYYHFSLRKVLLKIRIGFYQPSHLRNHRISDFIRNDFTLRCHISHVALKPVVLRESLLITLSNAGEIATLISKKNSKIFIIMHLLPVTSARRTTFL